MTIGRGALRLLQVLREGQWLPDLTVGIENLEFGVFVCTVGPVHIVPATLKKPHNYYLFAQCLGWGLFLILRIVLTIIYCAKHPDIDLPHALLLECGDHLAQAFSSHLIWVWMHKRKLFDRGLKSMLLEGYLLALILSIAITLLIWPACVRIYAEDLVRVGLAAMAWYAIMQHMLVTILWFSGLLAVYYFQRSRMLELQQVETVAAAKEAQLNALKGQINPHFLFNSFNSLRALIDENPTLARDAVTHLSVIMRYSLSSAERRYVTLGEELRVVALFLELEKLRLGERLKVNARIEGGLDACQIPPLMLQGLIENAVKFGPAARKNGGEIIYGVQREKDMLRLHVSNPGRLSTPSESTGTGLKNLKDRLALLYGSEARFTIQEEGECVMAELLIPMSRNTLS